MVGPPVDERGCNDARADRRRWLVLDNIIFVNHWTKYLAIWKMMIGQASGEARTTLCSIYQEQGIGVMIS